VGSVQGKKTGASALGEGPEIAAKAPERRRRLRGPEERLRDGGTGPWVVDGLAATTQQTEAVEPRRCPNCPAQLVLS